MFLSLLLSVLSTKSVYMSGCILWILLLFIGDTCGGDRDSLYTENCGFIGGINSFFVALF